MTSLLCVLLLSLHTTNQIAVFDECDALLAPDSKRRIQIQAKVWYGTVLCVLQMQMQTQIQIQVQMQTCKCKCKLASASASESGSEIASEVVNVLNPRYVPKHVGIRLWPCCVSESKVAESVSQTQTDRQTDRYHWQDVMGWDV